MRQEWELEIRQAINKLVSSYGIAKDADLVDWLFVLIKTWIRKAYKKGRLDKKLEIENEWQEFNKKMMEGFNYKPKT